jgi:uncharacterized protein (DUF1697 family)
VPTFVALLRGVNVGGHRLPMAELRALVEGMGHTRVRTYVQSGNLVFEGTGTPDRLAAELAAALADHCDFEVPVIVRSAEGLARTVAANPFLDEGLDPNAEPKLFHVTFLGGAPDAGAVAALEEATERYRPDTFRWRGTDVYLHIPGGYGETKLTNALFEKKLGVPATTRNWRSVTTLASMATE